jgi:hypothetical protein
LGLVSHAGYFVSRGDFEVRRFARIDDNQHAIVTALRSIGCSVQSLASVGKGCPDILVGRLGRNYLMEIKDGNKPPSERALTQHEVDWHEDWRGDVVVVCSVDDAIEAVKDSA